MNFTPPPSVLDCLNTFQAMAKDHPGPIPDSLTLAKPGPHVLIGCVMHGNEVGSLPGVLKFLDDVITEKCVFPGTVTVFLGNVPAAKKNVRFVEYDLNRAFHKGSGDTWEHRRAQEIVQLFDKAHLFIDFHQTLCPTFQPFYIFGFEPLSALWARALGGASVHVTRHPKTAFAAGLLGGDELFRQMGKPALTLELSEIGFTRQAMELSYNICLKLTKIFDSLFWKGQSLKDIARKNMPLQSFLVSYKFPFSDPTYELQPDLSNFATVWKGQILGQQGSSKQPIICPGDGLLLFPKYPKRDAQGVATGPLPTDLFQVVSSVPGSTLEKWARIAS